MDLADVIATGPQLRWFVARVVTVDITTSTVTLDYMGGLVPSVGYLDHVVPEQGQVAHGLIWDPNGMLVIGTNDKAETTHPTAPVPAAPLVVPASRFATYSQGLWDSVLLQGPEQYACWFYLSLLDPANEMIFADTWTMQTRRLASFEVEVRLSDGGPPEFFSHRMNGPGDHLQVVDRATAAVLPPIGVATWIPLPVTWGEQFIAGNILGIGIGGGYYSGAYSGTGRLRFTPMA